MTDRQSAAMVNMTPVLIDRIARRLLELGLTCCDASQKLGEHDYFIYDLCTGHTKSFSAKIVRRFSEVLQCDPGYLLDLRDVVETDLTLGDVVSLKSGGALMTVKRTRTAKSDFHQETITWVRCVWLDHVGHYHSDEFEDWLLKKITIGESA